MNKKIKLAVILLLAVVFFCAAVWGYGILSEKYAPDTFADPPALNGEEQTNDNNENTENDGRMMAPDFTVINENGEEVKLSDYFGKPIVMNFWATWCYYCKEEMPDFERAYKEYPDVQFLMVNATDGVRETVDIAKEYLEENGFTFPVVFDTRGEAVYSYYITGYPTTWFIDSEGYLVTYANSMLPYEALIEGISYITE
ncbi:MAG: TlpA family protein disulfide reductase [Clostridia bacterium]|nr:TlpA family protein disulfide reductase [Clostridia bacterium]